MSEADNCPFAKTEELLFGYYALQSKIRALILMDDAGITAIAAGRRRIADYLSYVLDQTARPPAAARFLYKAIVGPPA